MIVTIFVRGMTMKQTIFEKYQVRNSKKQKTAFIDYVKTLSDGMGYDCRTEKGSFGSRNIVVGDPDSAAVVYTAHYDTCFRSPFPNFITPKNIGIYLLFNIAIVLVFYLLMFVFGFAFGALLGLVTAALDLSEAAIDVLTTLVSALTALGVFAFMFFGPANKHTANDNTSGVITLLMLMEKMPAELRTKCAFVFFDKEELGMLGSSGFAKKHKELKKHTLVINFDCVSDGENFIFTLPKPAHDKEQLISDSYASDVFNVEVLKKGYVYPSDQAQFKNGVGVASLNRSKRFGILYMNRIHTNRDTVFNDENIDYLVASSVKLTRSI